MHRPEIEIEPLGLPREIDYNRLLECFGALVISRLYHSLPEYLILAEPAPSRERVCLQLLTTNGKTLLRFSGRNEEECARSLFEALQQYGALPAQGPAEPGPSWQ